MKNICMWESLSTYEQIELSKQMHLLLKFKKCAVKFHNTVKYYQLLYKKIDDFEDSLKIEVEQDEVPIHEQLYSKFFELYFTEGKTSKEIQELLNLDDKTTQRYKEQCNGF